MKVEVEVKEGTGQSLQADADAAKPARLEQEAKAQAEYDKKVAEGKVVTDQAPLVSYEHARAGLSMEPDTTSGQPTKGEDK